MSTHCDHTGTVETTLRPAVRADGNRVAAIRSVPYLACGTCGEDLSDPVVMWSVGRQLTQDLEQGLDSSVRTWTADLMRGGQQ